MKNVAIWAMIGSILIALLGATPLGVLFFLFGIQSMLLSLILFVLVDIRDIAKTMQPQEPEEPEIDLSDRFPTDNEPTGKTIKTGRRRTD